MHHVPAVVLLIPADIRTLGFTSKVVHQDNEPVEEYPDLAQLTSLTRLERLWLMSPVALPLPQLPALTELVVYTSDLQALSSVTGTLQHLDLVTADINFDQAYTLAHFTCLCSLIVDARIISNIKPEVLPPTLREITLSYIPHATLEDTCTPVFPDGGAILDNPPPQLEYSEYNGNVIQWVYRPPV